MRDAGCKKCGEVPRPNLRVHRKLRAHCLAQRASPNSAGPPRIAAFSKVSSFGGSHRINQKATKPRQGRQKLQFSVQALESQRSRAAKMKRTIERKNGFQILEYPPSVSSSPKRRRKMRPAEPCCRRAAEGSPLFHNGGNRRSPGCAEGTHASQSELTPLIHKVKSPPRQIRDNLVSRPREFRLQRMDTGL
jgi:hypothetical protein